ncbi:hypothetical protein [[Limnothrix rosea] IAM M-220]|uniref:hypothetical protein n=1 Tax=[Limnothrix rosea] IAM M-220 TaxID=454133 RepID=UPI0009594B00|nr:hypothetical protein [[Limnothrix rosea] IAM M-220]OKH20025.1 hypothetical protein NIES208_00705 [[Limnothrix rosea] IAM M-220]
MHISRLITCGFIAGLGISIFFTVKESGYAQTANSEPIISMSPPTTESPIGTRQGLEELADLFEASEATKAKPIRQVVISLPDDMPDQYRRRVAANTAIREFFLIADKKSFKYDGDVPRSAPDITAPQGFKAALPNGGTIALKLRKENNGKKQRTVGVLRLKDHQILGFEEVNQIEFIEK